MWKEFKLDIQIWDNDDWYSDYCLDVDAEKDGNKFFDYIVNAIGDEFEVVIKIRPKIGGEDNDD